MPSEPGPQLVIVILAITKVDEARKVNSAALLKDFDCRNSNTQRGARVQPRDVLSFAQTCSFSGQTCGECEKYSVGGHYRARVPSPIATKWSHFPFPSPTAPNITNTGCPVIVAASPREGLYLPAFHRPGMGRVSPVSWHSGGALRTGYGQTDDRALAVTCGGSRSRSGKSERWDES